MQSAPVTCAGSIHCHADFLRHNLTSRQIVIVNSIFRRQLDNYALKIKIIIKKQNTQLLGYSKASDIGVCNFTIKINHRKNNKLRKRQRITKQEKTAPYNLTSFNN